MSKKREVVVSSANPPADFADLQKNMENELERRRKDWEKEVEQMSEDFFNVKLVKKEGDAPGITVTSPSERPLSAGTEVLNLKDSNEVYTVLADGSRVFRQKFDVQGYEPGDLQVKVDGNAIRVTAKHEEKYGGKTSSSRQFNRQVDVPEDVNPDKLVSYLSPDGVLTLEAPVEAPTTPRKSETTTVSRSSPFGTASGPPQYEAIVKSANQNVYNSPVIEDCQYGKKMKMVIKMGGSYDPEDLTIQLFDHKVTVKAKHEESIGGRSSKREFSREFDLPKPLYERSFRAAITPDGNLVFGGSLRENEDQRSMAQVIQNDMPRNGKYCYVDNA